MSYGWDRCTYKEGGRQAGRKNERTWHRLIPYFLKTVGKKRWVILLFHLCMKITDPENPSQWSKRENLLFSASSRPCALRLPFLCFCVWQIPRSSRRRARNRYRDVPAPPRRPKDKQVWESPFCAAHLARKTDGLGTSQRTIQTQERCGLGACTSWWRGCKTDVNPTGHREAEP